MTLKKNSVKHIFHAWETKINWTIDVKQAEITAKLHYILNICISAEEFEMKAEKGKRNGTVNKFQVKGERYWLLLLSALI